MADQFNDTQKRPSWWPVRNETSHCHHAVPCTAIGHYVRDSRSSRKSWWASGLTLVTAINAARFGHQALWDRRGCKTWGTCEQHGVTSGSKKLTRLTPGRQNCPWCFTIACRLWTIGRLQTRERTLSYEVVQRRWWNGWMPELPDSYNSRSYGRPVLELRHPQWGWRVQSRFFVTVWVYSWPMRDPLAEVFDSHQVLYRSIAKHIKPLNNLPHTKSTLADIADQHDNMDNMHATSLGSSSLISIVEVECSQRPAAMLSWSTLPQ